MRFTILCPKCQSLIFLKTSLLLHQIQEHNTTYFDEQLVAIRDSNTAVGNLAHQFREFIKGEREGMGSIRLPVGVTYDCHGNAAHDFSSVEETSNMLENEIARLCDLQNRTFSRLEAFAEYVSLQLRSLQPEREKNCTCIGELKLILEGMEKTFFSRMRRLVQETLNNSPTGAKQRSIRMRKAEGNIESITG